MEKRYFPLMIFLPQTITLPVKLVIEYFNRAHDGWLLFNMHGTVFLFMVYQYLKSTGSLKFEDKLFYN